MKLSPRHTSVLVALALAVATVAPAAAQPKSKLDRFLRDERHRGAATYQVIVQSVAGHQAALKKSLLARGVAVTAEHPALGALTVTVDARQLSALESDPSVLNLSADAEVRSLHARGSRVRSEAGDVLRETLGLGSVPFNGIGINVAVVDSGIDPSKDLASNIAGFWDFTQGGIATRPYDDFGHGTHVAGLIASTGFESNKQFAGVAPGASLYGFKVLDAKGSGRSSDVVRALEFITANKLSSSPSAFKIDIVNLSLGHPIYEPAANDPLVRAVENAVHAGIIVVTAAGNLGIAEDGDPAYAGITSPGNSPSAVTVGAADTAGTISLNDDIVAPFSSRGPSWFDGFAKPDLVAPGVGLMSDVPRFSSLFDSSSKASTTGRGSFAKLSGTSMAAAVTSGAAALVLQASRLSNVVGPALSAHTLKGILQFTAIPLEDAARQRYDALTQGTGELNVGGAITMALAINTSMPAGTPWLRFQPEPVTVVGSTTYSWSQAVLWDDNIVWGTDALAYNSAQWDDNIVWGTALGGDDNIVWGTAADVDNIVWGTTTVWATNLVWPDRLVGMISDENIVWGTALGLTEDNIVWGTLSDDNIVWGTWSGDNLVWGTSAADNIVWGTSTGDNLVWGTADIRR